MDATTQLANDVHFLTAPLRFLWRLIWCSLLPCCSVTLPTLWNSRRESNPDLFVRTEASSCLRPREQNCGGDAEN